MIPIKCRLLLVGSKLARCKTLSTFYALVLLNFKVESSFKPEPSLSLLVLSAIEPNLPINIHSTISILLQDLARQSLGLIYYKPKIHPGPMSSSPPLFHLYFNFKTRLETRRKTLKWFNTTSTNHLEYSFSSGAPTSASST